MCVYHKWYLAKENLTDKTFEELYSKHYDNVKKEYEYLMHHSISIKVYNDCIDLITKRKAQKEFDQQSNKTKMIQVLIHRDDEKEEKAMFENQKHFIKWL